MFSSSEVAWAPIAALECQGLLCIEQQDGGMLVPYACRDIRWAGWRGCRGLRELPFHSRCLLSNDVCISADTQMHAQTRTHKHAPCCIHRLEIICTC